jgi:hypothetical protein
LWRHNDHALGVEPELAGGRILRARSQLARVSGELETEVEAWRSGLGSYRHDAAARSTQREDQSE